MICPWIDEMIHEPGILDAAEDLIGPDILCWGTSLRAKAADGKVFDRIDSVAERYCNDRPRPVIEVWKMNRQVKCISAGGLLRLVASSPFLLHWTDDEWTTKRDTASTPTSIGIEYADIRVAPSQTAPIRFTFYWPQQSQWQGTDYQVDITQ